jgi:N utilization substance protein B
VSQHGEAARRAIESTSSNWPIERIGLIDRLVMELALSELEGDDPPPTAVVLDEAVDLAKTYSTEGSGSFVNGVLSAIIDPTS